MRVRLAIGDFSRMTHLTVKALRHYHEIGLLVPSEVDAASGYRFYEPGQVRTAHLIRRLRDLGLPLDRIRSVLEAPSVEERNRLLAEHLGGLEAQLLAVQATWATLQALLEVPIDVSYRSIGAQLALAITERVAAEDLDAWWDTAFRELDAAVSNVDTVGPRAALYSPDFFTLGAGDVTAYRPVAAAPREPGRVALTEIPAAELAIAVHHGSFSNIDQTYGLLGTHVAEREIGLPGAIREIYVVSPFDSQDETSLLTEVGWPIFRVA